MVEVVPGHGFEQGLDGEVATFRVMRGTLEVGLAESADELEVPAPGGAEEFERGGGVVCGVALRPSVLIEGLQECWRAGRCRKGLAESEAVHELAVGEVRDDLARAPLAGSDGCLDLLRSERAERLVEEPWCGGEDGACILRAEICGVGIDHGKRYHGLASGF